MPAVLAHIIVPLENIMPGEFDLFLGHAIKHDQQNDPWNAELEGDGMNAFWMRLLLGKILPLVKTVSLEGAVLRPKNHLGMTFKEQRKGASGSADIYRLPQSVEHQYMLV